MYLLIKNIIHSYIYFLSFLALFIPKWKNQISKKDVKVTCGKAIRTSYGHGRTCVALLKFKQRKPWKATTRVSNKEAIWLCFEKYDFDRLENLVKDIKLAAKKTLRRVYLGSRPEGMMICTCDFAEAWHLKQERNARNKNGKISKKTSKMILKFSLSCEQLDWLRSSANSKYYR